jgi:hypothetical protein
VLFPDGAALAGRVGESSSLCAAGRARDLFSCHLISFLITSWIIFYSIIDYRYFVNSESWRWDVEIHLSALAGYDMIHLSVVTIR